MGHTFFTIVAGISVGRKRIASKGTIWLKCALDSVLCEKSLGKIPM